MGGRQRNGRVWGDGQREEGWATVICRSINCRPGRGHRGLLAGLPQPTLALTREREIVEPWLFAPGGRRRRTRSTPPYK